MGVSREEFYESGMFAIVPMDFYFPGHGKSGDLPPRKGFADKWHEKVLALAPDIQLTILVGNYAQRYYLHQKSSAKLTDTVKHYKDYLPEFFLSFIPLLEIIYGKPKSMVYGRSSSRFEGSVKKS